MNDKMEMVKRKIEEIKKERNELREKYEYLVEQIKKTMDTHSQDIALLKKELGGIGKREERNSEKTDSLRKSLDRIESSQTLLKEKFEEEVELMKRNVESDVSEMMKAVRSELVDSLKREIEKSFEGLEELKNDVKNLQGVCSLLEEKFGIVKGETVKDIKKLSEKAGKNSEKIAGLRSLFNSLNKQLSGMENELLLLKKRGTEHEKTISRLSDMADSLKKTISEIEGRQKAIQDELNSKIEMFEKEMGSELSKIRGFEERMGKDIEDFEKFAGEQKARMEKFESGVSSKIDMFSIEKENLKKEFSSLLGDFKNLSGTLDSLKERDSEFERNLQGLKLELENFRKVTEEVTAKLKEDQTIFKENVVAKLNEASEKLINRISQHEMKTSSELLKQSEEIKMFRAHVTQFINDLVSNYEKRFDMIKNEIDRALKLMEERAKEQTAMIFE